MLQGSAATRPPPVVLIVEDDMDTREMYAEWLAFLRVSRPRSPHRRGALAELRSSCRISLH